MKAPSIPKSSIMGAWKIEGRNCTQKKNPEFLGWLADHKFFDAIELFIFTFILTLLFAVGEICK